MDIVSVVLSRLSGWSSNRQGVFALSCVEQVLPVYAVFAERPEGKSDFEGVLNWSWLYTSSAVQNHEEVDRWREAISGWPEKDIDDSTAPGYYSMVSLSALDCSLQVLRGDDAPRFMGFVLGAVFQVMADFDYILSSDFSYTPIRETKPGAFEVRESNRQQALIDRINNSIEVDVNFVADVRLDAMRFRDEFGEQLSRVKVAIQERRRRLGAK